MKPKTLLGLVALVSITFAHAADPAVTNLPAGWTVADLGAVRRPGVVSYDAETKAFASATVRR